VSDDLLDAVAKVAVFLIGGGFTVASLALYEAATEYQIAREVGNGRLMYAKATLRSQALRASNLLALGAIAIIVLAGVSDARGITVILFMYLIISNAGDAVLDFLTTRKMLAYYQGKLTSGERR
jgi:hypothetical protein